MSLYIRVWDWQSEIYVTSPIVVYLSICLIRFSISTTGADVASDNFCSYEILIRQPSELLTEAWRKLDGKPQIGFDGNFGWVSAKHNVMLFEQ